METCDLVHEPALSEPNPAWNFAFEQLIQKEPEPPIKKSTPGRPKVTLTVGQLVRLVENSSISLHEAARIRMALAGHAHNYAMTPERIEQVVTASGVNRNELLKVLGLQIYPW